MPRRSREEIRVVLCLFLVLFLGVADSQIVSPLLPAIRARVARSSLEMGHLFTGYSLSAGLSVLIWGPLSDLFGRRRGLLAGLALFASGSRISFLASAACRSLNCFAPSAGRPRRGGSNACLFDSSRPRLSGFRHFPRIAGSACQFVPHISRDHGISRLRWYLVARCVWQDKQGN